MLVLLSHLYSGIPQCFRAFKEADLLGKESVIAMWAGRQSLRLSETAESLKI